MTEPNAASGQAQAPLYEALRRHAERETSAFHVPGHKQRAMWQSEEANGQYRDLLPLDVTELSDTDDLHDPTGVIAEAQRLAAACFGAEETCFLVGGSTAGNLAMLLGVCSPGDLVLTHRNVHKSILHALMLGGLRAVLLPPLTDPGSGLATLPSPDLVREAIGRYPEARALVLTNPNYYGMAADLVPYVEAAHLAGIPVLVDEAHGAHFGLHPAFPRSALQAGADVVVQSAHKMLSAMTMGAMLHLQGRLAPREDIRQALRMLQSSSPSYPILASLDLTRQRLAQREPDPFEGALRAAEIVRDKLPEPFASLHGDGGQSAAEARMRLDPLKLVLRDGSGVLDGFALRDELERSGCIAEMADPRYVVLALGQGTIPEDGERLLRALEEIASRRGLRSRAARTLPASPAETMHSPAQTVPEPTGFRRRRAETRLLPLAQCVGRIAGALVVPYPPGIPALYPGETITARHLEELQDWKRRGARIQGLADPTMERLEVYRDE